VSKGDYEAAGSTVLVSMPLLACPRTMTCHQRSTDERFRAK
jgi:hypothetical protein